MRVGYARRRGQTTVEWLGLAVVAAVLALLIALAIHPSAQAVGGETERVVCELGATFTGVQCPGRSSVACDDESPLPPANGCTGATGGTGGTECSDGSTVPEGAACPTGDTKLCPSGVVVGEDDPCPANGGTKVCKNEVVVPADADCPVAQGRRCSNDVVVPVDQKCPVVGTRVCEDGVVVPVGTGCPPEMRQCSNGEWLPVSVDCPPEMHKCWNGKWYPVSVPCPPPPEPAHKCWDGKWYPASVPCPTRPRCADGSWKPVIGSCPLRDVASLDPNCMTGQNFNYNEVAGTASLLAGFDHSQWILQVMSDGGVTATFAGFDAVGPSTGGLDKGVKAAPQIQDVLRRMQGKLGADASANAQGLYAPIHGDGLTVKFGGPGTTSAQNLAEAKRFIGRRAELGEGGATPAAYPSFDSVGALAKSVKGHIERNARDSLPDAGGHPAIRFKDDAGYVYYGETEAKLSAGETYKRFGAKLGAKATGSLSGYADLVVLTGKRIEDGPVALGPAPGATDKGLGPAPGVADKAPGPVDRNVTYATGADGKPVGTLTKRYQVRVRGTVAARGGVKVTAGPAGAHTDVDVGLRYEPFLQKDLALQVMYANDNGDDEHTPDERPISATMTSERTILPSVDPSRSIELTQNLHPGKGLAAFGGSIAALGNSQRGTTITDTYTVDLRERPELAAEIEGDAEDTWGHELTTESDAEDVFNRLRDRAGNLARHDHMVYDTLRRQNNRRLTVEGKGGTGAIDSLSALLGTGWVGDENVQYSRVLKSAETTHPGARSDGKANPGTLVHKGLDDGAEPPLCRAAAGPQGQYDSGYDVDERGGQVHTLLAVDATAGLKRLREPRGWRTQVTLPNGGGCGPLAPLLISTCAAAGAGVAGAGGVAAAVAACADSDDTKRPEDDSGCVQDSVPACDPLAAETRRQDPAATKDCVAAVHDVCDAAAAAGHAGLPGCGGAGLEDCRRSRGADLGCPGNGRYVIGGVAYRDCLFAADRTFLVVDGPGACANTARQIGAPVDAGPDVAFCGLRGGASPVVDRMVTINPRLGTCPPIPRNLLDCDATPASPDCPANPAQKGNVVYWIHGKSYRDCRSDAGAEFLIDTALDCRVVRDQLPGLVAFGGDQRPVGTLPASGLGAAFCGSATVGGAKGRDARGRGFDLPEPTAVWTDPAARGCAEALAAAERDPRRFCGFDAGKPIAPRVKRACPGHLDHPAQDADRAERVLDGVGREIDRLGRVRSEAAQGRPGAQQEVQSALDTLAVRWTQLYGVASKVGGFRHQRVVEALKAIVRTVAAQAVDDAYSTVPQLSTYPRADADWGPYGAAWTKLAATAAALHAMGREFGDDPPAELADRQAEIDRLVERVGASAQDAYDAAGRSRPEAPGCDAQTGYWRFVPWC